MNSFSAFDCSSCHYCIFYQFLSLEDQRTAQVAAIGNAKDTMQIDQRGESGGCYGTKRTRPMTRMSATLLRAMIAMPLLSDAAHADSRVLFSPMTATPIMRTYVSGLGSDANPCTADHPCATFQAALALTLAGGEIFVLNSANYGPITITKAVTITSEGAVAGILATSGTAVTINAGANDVVNLRGLGVDGANTGGAGIQFNSGKSLTIQNSFVRNFTNSGIYFAPGNASTLFVSDTVVTNNGSNGILVSSASNTVNAALSRVTASGNGVGILASGAGVSLAVTNAVANNNSYGFGATSSVVMVNNSTASNNTVGIAADQRGGTVRVGQSTITGNGMGWQGTNGGQVVSFGNNNLGGNITDGTATTTLALQ
jgi:hypothetical protein